MIGDVALLELVGEHLEPDQQQQQVGDEHPFVLEVSEQRVGSASGWEGRDECLEGEDDEQAADADLQRALVKQRYRRAAARTG